MFDFRVARIELIGKLLLFFKNIQALWKLFNFTFEFRCYKMLIEAQQFLTIFLILKFK